MNETGEKTYQDGLIRALFYLYQEAIKENMPKFAQIIQVAIESCERVEDTADWSRNCEDILKQFYILREFRKLNDLQKQLFIQEIECLQSSG